VTEGEVKAGLNGTNGFGMPLLGFPKIALPGTFGEFSEQGVARAREGCEKIKAASEEMTEALRETYSSNARSATDYGLKVIEISNANTAAAIDFFAHLLDSKSMTDVFSLSATQAHKASTPHPPRARTCWNLPRSLRHKQASRSGSCQGFSPGRLNNSKAGIRLRRYPAGWKPHDEQASPSSPTLDQAKVRIAPQVPAHRQEAQSNRPVFFVSNPNLQNQVLKNQVQGRFTWEWSWSNARKPDTRSPPASRPIARAFGAARCFSRAPVVRSATPITPGSPRKPGSTSRAPGRIASRARSRDRPPIRR
jgi:hypothetical protein